MESGSSVGNKRMCMLTQTAIRISTTFPSTNGTTKAAEYPIVSVRNTTDRIFVLIGIPFPSCQFLM
uniref:Uncharacterized protein n=1 Tax=Candidatus Methanogaster sp. ANME-2c ERB4 TaxID=2759911 RepID=A0A7G9YK23_9EURY|nr:hypothetical protein KGAOHLBL_00001 [Methanosarcinales archaeon ANME-2c ERB4]